MKPRLYVHAGLHKTGTSYIQRFLHNNAKLLSERGVLYPWHPEGKYHHTFLVELFRSGGMNRVAEYFRKISEKPNSAFMISSEEWSKDFNSVKRVEWFRDILADRFDVHFIYYLRRQDHLRESVFAEIVKGWFVGSINDVRFRFDFSERLNPLIEVFGTESITIRPYNSKLWSGGDLAYDVLSAIGIDNHSGFVLPMRDNESMPRRKTLFLSEVEKPHRLKKIALIERVAKTTAIRDDGMKYLASPEERADFYERFRRSNSETLAMFGINDADAFLGYAKPDANWFPPESITDAERKALE